MKIPIIGQEAICPDGLGRVVAYGDVLPSPWIQVNTYFNNRGCKWAPENVELIDPRKCPSAVFHASEVLENGE